MFAVKPDIATGVSAGSGLLKLGIEIQRTLFGRGGDSAAALARIRRRVSVDLEQWAASEGLLYGAEIAVADGLLERHLPEILIDRASVAQAAKAPEGLVEAGTALLMRALIKRAPFFDVGTNPAGVAYAEAVISIALEGVLTERAYFEALEPHLLLGLVRSTAEVEEVVRATDRKVDEVLALLASRHADPSLSEREVRGILNAFDLAGVEFGDAVEAILTKAEEYQALKGRLDRHADSRTRAALQSVRIALDEGDLPMASARLHQLLNQDDDREERSIRVTLEIIEYHATLSSFMLRHDVAAQAYFQASAVAATVNGEKSYHYSMMQADELIQHALRSPDVSTYQTVVSLFGSLLPRFKPESERSVETFAHIISAMGQMAERIEATRAEAALKVILELEEAVKSANEASWFPPIWAGILSDIAAVQNNLASRAGDDDNGMSRCLDAEHRLRAALEICEKLQLPSLRVVQTNLATTLRNLGCNHRRDVAAIDAAIALRKQSMRALGLEEIRDCSNAYDSLGSDYKALAILQGWSEPTTVHNALRAYRTGLRIRRSASFVLDVSRSHRNIASLHVLISRVREGERKLRSLRHARNHLGKALEPLDAIKSPGDWFAALRAWIQTSLAINESEPLAIADMIGLGNRIGDLLDASVDQHSFAEMFESLTDALSMIAVMLEDGREELSPVARRYGAVLERLVPVLAYSPIAVHSEFWLLQSQFAEACLARDFTNAELVLEKVQDRVASLSSGDQTDADELRTLVSELTASMVRIKSVSPQTSISS